MDLSNEPLVRVAIPGYPNYFLTPDGGVWSYWEKRNYGEGPWLRLKGPRYNLYNVVTAKRARVTREEVEQAIVTGTPPTTAAESLTLSDRVRDLEARVKALEAK